MNERPEALRWAAILEHQAKHDGATDYKHNAAAELRRLHQENERLREAVSAEREACAKVCEEQLTYFTPISCPDKISGCLVDHHGPVQRKKTATECAAAIRARGEQEQPR